MSEESLYIGDTESEIVDGDGVRFAATYADSSGVRAKRARRLVACWNACVGIPTDWMESHPIGSIDATLASANAENDELKRQRDVLLDTLHKTRSALRNPIGQEQYRQIALESADAAIADVEEGE